MNGVVLLLALAVPAVDYGWRVTDGGDVECIVQVEPALLSAMIAGDAPRALVRDSSPQGSRPARFVLQIGDDQLPRETPTRNAVSAADYRVDKPSFPNAQFAKHGWRLLADGGIECIIHLSPRLAQAVLDGRASTSLTGERLPETSRPLQYVVYVSDEPLPNDAVDARELVRLEASSNAPRVLQLSHVESAALSSGRTVFETQLQLRRGEADSRFDIAEQAATPTRAENPRYGAGNATEGWNDRGAATATSIGDTPSSRYASPTRAAGSDGNRYGSDPDEGNTAGGGGLQIRYGDGDRSTNAPLESPANVRSSIVDGGPTRFASDPGRYSASPTAPPLAGPAYGGNRDRTPAPRTSLGPTAAGPAATTNVRPLQDPGNTGYLPPGGGYASGQGYDNGQGYGGGPTAASGQAGYNYPPEAYAARPTTAPNGMLPDPRIASRGGYQGPFGGGFDADPSSAGGAPAKTKRTSEDDLDEDKLDGKSKKKVTDEAEPQWMPLVMTVMALLASLSGNAYLGLMAYGLYRRYRDVTDEMRSAPDFASSSVDGDDERPSSGGRRRRRSRLAARF